MPPDARLEIKLIGGVLDVPAIEQWIGRHTLRYRTAFPPRRVNNLYFETPGYGCYWDNASGQSDRAKVRFRWYGDTFAPDRGVLEVKRRRNLFGWKELYPVDTPVFSPDQRYRNILADLDAQLPPRGKLFRQWADRPILINRYDRRYWVSADGRFRVTLDEREQAFDQRFGARPNVSRKVLLATSVVLELKLARADRIDAQAALDGCPLRISRHSKYAKSVLSMAQITSGAKRAFVTPTES